MLGLDALSSVIRATPAPNNEVKPLWIEAPVAQQLGLSDGQVVQALVEARGGPVRLWLKNFSFELPNGWVLQPGDTPFMRVVRGSSSWALLIQPRADGAPSAGLVANAPSAANVQAPISPEQLLQARMQAMASRPMDASGLLALLASSSQNASGLTSAQMPWLQAWMAESIPMSQINPSLLRNLLQKWMLPNERRLLQGQQPPMDARSMLRKWLDLLTATQESSTERMQEARTVRQGLESLDTAQAQTALAHARGGLSLHFWIPFTDSRPVHMHIQRDAPKNPNDDPPFTVDVHTQHMTLGEIWLATTIRSSHRVGLVMWALNGNTASWARDKSALLGAELKDSGLELESFQIHHAARPRSEVHPVQGSGQGEWMQTVRPRLDRLA
ncbi:MAG: hypothetical protein RL307_475 [Pseudomonadota bacterium]